MPSATHATLTAPNALIDTLRASGLGQGRLRRIEKAPTFAAVRVSLPDGRWLQAAEILRAGEVLRVFTVDPGPDAEQMKTLAESAGWDTT